jgi:hypothetical protein
MISLNGICLAAASDGQACSDTFGPYCFPWASCVGGVCKTPTFGACN